MAHEMNKNTNPVSAIMDIVDNNCTQIKQENTIAGKVSCAAVISIGLVAALVGIINPHSE